MTVAKLSEQTAATIRIWGLRLIVIYSHCEAAEVEPFAARAVKEIGKAEGNHVREIKGGALANAQKVAESSAA